MLSRKEQTKAFVISAVLYGIWHATGEWTKLLSPFLQWDSQITMFQISIIYALGNLCTLVGTFIIGHLMDTSGPRLAGFLATIFSFSYHIASTQAGGFVGFLLIQPLRLGFCLNQVIESYLASVTEANHRTKIIMRLGIPIGIAAIVGPWFASKTAVSFDIRGSVICAALVLIACCLPLLLFVLPMPAHLPDSKKPRMLRFSDYQDLASNQALRNTLLIRCLLDGPYMTYDNLSRQFIISRFMTSYSEMSYLFVVLGFTTVFANTVLIKILQIRFDKPQRLLQFALVLSAVSYFIISFAQEFYQFLIIMPLQVIGMSIVYAELAAQTSNSVDRHQIGKAVGLGHAATLLAATIFSLTAGFFVSEFDFNVWCYFAALVSLVALTFVQYYGSYMNSHLKQLPNRLSSSYLSG